MILFNIHFSSKPIQKTKIHMFRRTKYFNYEYEQFKIKKTCNIHYLGK